MASYSKYTSALTFENLILKRQSSIVALYSEYTCALTFENFFWYQAVDRFSHPPNVKRPLKLPLPQAFFLFILFLSLSPSVVQKPR